MQIRLALALCLFVAAPANAPAQSVPQQSVPAELSHVEGTVTIEHAGTSEQASVSTPIVPGDRLVTRNGRVEITLGSETLVQLDSATTIDLLSPTLARLWHGRIRVFHASARPVFRVDADPASAFLYGPGEFVLAHGGRYLEVSVVRGDAILQNEHGEMRAAPGERLLAASAAAPEAHIFNSARLDDFDRWADARRLLRSGPTSGSYLPAELRHYAGALDRAGSWRHESTYGYVWYPSVTAGWRPYFHGRWRFLRGHGWTWIGRDVWTWPTHHYGRWGVRHGVWFWIPGTVWAPAWVQWAYAPGVIGWCALAVPASRPQFAANGVFDARDRHAATGAYAPGRFDPTGWTFVHRDRIDAQARVPDHAMDWRMLDEAVRGAVVLQPAQPSPPPRAAWMVRRTLGGVAQQPRTPARVRDRAERTASPLSQPPPPAEFSGGGRAAVERPSIPPRAPGLMPRPVLPRPAIPIPDRAIPRSNVPRPPGGIVGPRASGAIPFAPLFSGPGRHPMPAMPQISGIPPYPGPSRAEPRRP